MKRILVPCDFSPPALEAYKFALELASAAKGEIFVIHVIDIPMTYESTFGLPPYLFDTALIKELEESAKKSFTRMRESFPQASCPVTFNALQGPVSLTIRSLISSRNIDLVIMGTQGASGAGETFVGSNTEKIVRYSSVPVISLRKAPPLSTIKDIVYPTSFEPDQEAIIDELKALQNFFQAKLHLLYINTPHKFMRDNQINGAAQAYVKVHKLQNYTVNMRSDFQEEHGIIAFAYEIKAGMIAMATHGRRGLSHILNESIAEEVVNHHIACPVWTFSLRKHHAEAVTA